MSTDVIVPKIIFLDIDGVLNSADFDLRRAPAPDKAHGSDLEDLEGWGGDVADIDAWREESIDVEAVKVLQQIVAQTQAKVVVSSTWRHSSMDFLTRYLGRYGIEVIGRTTILSDCDDCVRGNLIHKWLRDNRSYDDNTPYLILDDDCDMLYFQRHNFVHIQGRHGLLPEHIDGAVKILMSGTVNG